MSRDGADDVASEAIIRAATYATLDVARLDQFLVTAVRRMCANRKRHDFRAQSVRYRTSSASDIYNGHEDVTDRLVVADLIAGARLAAEEGAVLTLARTDHRHAETRRTST